jgi:hypothetical protein
MASISKEIERNMRIDSVWDSENEKMIYVEKRPYVNKAQVRIQVENMTETGDRNDWLAPASNMLLIKESSMERFFKNHELPTDTCALICSLTQGTDSIGDAIYYYTYDLSDFLTNQLRHASTDSILNMLLVPVTIETTTTSSSATAITSVKQQQTMSATKIRSAQNGLKLELVYSGF